MYHGQMCRRGCLSQDSTSWAIGDEFLQRYTHISYITRIIWGCTRTPRVRSLVRLVPMRFRMGRTWCVFLRLYRVHVPGQVGPANHRTRRNKHIPRKALGCASDLSNNSLKHKQSGSSVTLLLAIPSSASCVAESCTPWGGASLSRGIRFRW